MALAVALVLEVTAVDHAVVRWLEVACGGLVLGAAVAFSDRFPEGTLCLFAGAAAGEAARRIEDLVGTGSTIAAAVLMVVVTATVIVKRKRESVTAGS